MVRHGVHQCNTDSAFNESKLAVTEYVGTFRLRYNFQRKLNNGLVRFNGLFASKNLHRKPCLCGYAAMRRHLRFCFLINIYLFVSPRI